MGFVYTMAFRPCVNGSSVFADGILLLKRLAWTSEVLRRHACCAASAAGRAADCTDLKSRPLLDSAFSASERVPCAEEHDATAHDSIQ